MEQDTQTLPAHVEKSVRAVERLRTDHRRQATHLERSFERATALLGRPAFLGVVTLLVLLWIGGNLLLLRNGRPALDVPPFPWLEGALTLMAVYMAALILTTQRRADRLASHREQMTLQLAILSEQKAAKLIALVEELRRDSPEITDRIDSEAQAMATHANPEAVSQAIKEIQLAERRTIPGPEIDGARTVHATE
jgi:uncharacterized membrane protein